MQCTLVLHRAISVATRLTHVAQEEALAAKEAELQALAARLAAFEGVPPVW